MGALLCCFCHYTIKEVLALAASFIRHVKDATFESEIRLKRYLIFSFPSVYDEKLSALKHLFICFRVQSAVMSARCGLDV